MELPRRLRSALHTLTAAVDLLEGAVLQGDALQEKRLAALLAANSEVGVRLDHVAAALRALSDQPESLPHNDTPAAHG